MDLRRHLKQVRARPKEPFPRRAFTTVAALVREHHLDESFLDRIKANTAQGVEWVWSYEPQAKSPFTPPLFALVTPQELPLIQTILAAVDNPYVPLAHSPDELLASGPLFCLHPDLPPGLLERVHFRALLAREIIQGELKDREPRPDDGAAGTPAPRAALERLLNRLNDMINREN